MPRPRPNKKSAFFEDLIRRESFKKEIAKIKKYIKFKNMQNSPYLSVDGLDFYFKKKKIPLKFFSHKKSYSYNMKIIHKPTIGSVYREFPQTLNAIVDYLAETFKTKEVFGEYLKNYFINEENNNERPPENKIYLLHALESEEKRNALVLGPIADSSWVGVIL